MSSTAALGNAIVCSNEQLVRDDKQESRWLVEGFAADWQIDGEPLFRWAHQNGRALTPKVYRHLVDDAQILSVNLATSFSGLCLAGRGTGEAPTREMYGSVRFRLDETEYRLSDLLTVHRWNKSDEVSRVCFFNPLTDQFDRHTCAPSLVVADGDLSLLKVLERKEFERSDVIGVVHRTMERDRLELVGDRMTALRQWYVEDAKAADIQDAAPRGISVAIFRHRED